MSLFVFDTDLLTLYEQGNANVLKNVVLHMADSIAISVISIEEQLAGWQNVLNKAKLDSRRETDLSAHGADRRIARRPGPYCLIRLQRCSGALHFFSALRLNVGSNDLKIAAIALEFNAVVVTRKCSRFSREFPGVSWVDWSN